MFCILRARSFCSLVLLSFVWALLPDRVEAQLELLGLGNRRTSDQDTKKAKQEFANEFPLIVTAGSIGFEFPADVNEASSIVGQMAKGGSSGTSQGGTGFACSSSNDSVESEICKDMPQNGVMRRQIEPFESVLIKGKGSNLWSTLFLKTEQRFLCSHFDFSGKIMFQMISNKSGVQVILFDGPEMVSLKGKNYFDLVSQPEFQQIVDRSESWGIKLPSNANSSMMDELMLAVFSLSETDWENFEKDFSDLTAATYKEREEATKRLKKELNQWKQLVAWGLTNPEVSLELKSRLMAVIKDNETEEAAKQIFGLTSAKLMDNPEKLVELLSSSAATDEKVRMAIVERLQRLTEKDFGSDVAAWQKWSNDSKKVSANQLAAQLEDTKPVEGAADEQEKSRDANVTKRVTIELVREEVSKLLTLDVNDQDQIRVDRDLWAKTFGEKNIPQLLKETQKQFRESGLPASWLNLGGGYDLSTIDFPQMLFAQLDERLTTKSQSDLALRQMQMNMQMNMHRMNNQRGLRLNKSLNREIQNGEISFRLELHPETHPGMQEQIAQPKFFKFRYLDDVQNTSLILDEPPDGDFNLMICNIETGEFVGIGQNDKRSWIHVCTKSGSFSASDESPRKLFKEHADEWKRLLHPVLQHYGINLTELAGGKLEIKNAVLKAERRGMFRR